MSTNKNKTITLIDNYDSFTYNLVQYLGDLGVTCDVHRNDAVSVDDVLKTSPQGILLSPGPRAPEDAGICLDMVMAAHDHDIPLFGVCLGHQSIGQAFGGKVIRADFPMHGKKSIVTHNNISVFKGLDSDIEVTRYHSLIVERDTLPAQLRVTAECDGIIMGLQHESKPIHGVQFHPESIATQQGHAMLQNFVDML